MPADILIQGRNLVKKYGDLTAVNGVDFEVHQGECFGFLGPNGAGKSTLMKMIHCFSPRTSGELSVFGLDPDEKPAEIKNRLGVVAQTNNLDEEITVVQNLEIYGRYFGFSPARMKDKIRELLGFMALEARADSRVRELSGGMMRRLVIARALLNDPDLIILDEPTTGLDPQVRHLIWAKLRELKSQGVTLLLTTHYMEEAQHLCDRLLVIDKGKVLTQGAPKDLVKTHLPPFVLETSGQGRGKLLPLPEGVKTEVVGDILLVYGPTVMALDEVAARLEAPSHIRPTNLEDLFLTLTGRELAETD
jgi:lipooligosaccharide transport system ATP-binding protein